jgi:hypothetical protein
MKVTHQTKRTKSGEISDEDFILEIIDVMLEQSTNSFKKMDYFHRQFEAHFNDKINYHIFKSIMNNIGFGEKKVQGLHEKYIQVQFKDGHCL